MALDITRGLFGIELPASSLDDDQAQALAFAQLSPDQAVRASGMMSGSMLGRGIGNLGRAAVGHFTGADVRTPDEKRQAAQMRAIQMIKEGGINPDDPAAYLPIVARAFQEQGLVEDALKAVTALEGLKLNRGKLAVDEAKAGAAVLAERTRAAAEAREASTGDKVQKLAQTGKFVPKSLAKFATTGKYEDLQLEDKDEFIELDTDKGIVLVPKATAADKSTWIQAGTKRTDLTSDERLLGRWNELLKKATSDDGSLNWNNLTQAELAEMKGLSSNDKILGKQGARAFFDDLAVDLGVEESKALASIIRGEVFDAQFTELANTWLPKANTKGLTAWFQAMQEAGEKGVTATAAMGILKDPETSRYVASAIRFINAILRRESGAAVTEAEWMRYGVGYIPMPGDGPEAIKEKEAARKLWLQSEVDAFTPPMRSLYKKSSVKAGMSAGGNPKRPVIERAAEIYASGDEAKWRAFYKSLTPEEREELNKRMRK